MILAADLLLLILDDESGTPRLPVGGQLEVALGGAVLADLAIRGNVAESAGSGLLRRAKVHTLGAPPTDTLLAEKLAVVAARPRTAEDLVGRLGRGVQRFVVTDLVARGVLVERTRRGLGVFPLTRWSLADATYRARLLETMATTLATDQVDPRARALIAILARVGALHHVVGVRGWSTHHVRRRSMDLGRGDWVAQAVRASLDARSGSGGG